MSYMQISDMIQGVNIISGKVSVAIVNADGGLLGCSETTERGGGGGEVRVRSALRKFLDSKEDLDWLEIDLNVAEIITAQYCKHKKT